MMKRFIAAAAIAVALLAPARADYFIKDGRGVEKTIKAGTVSGTILPYSTPTDSTGIPYSAANPMPITFGTSVQLPSFASPQHFICDSGCGGSGSSYTVTYTSPIGTLGTPTGFKDASGNFQSLLGDTTNGQWVNIKASVPLAVTGTFFQATQPVSMVSLPAFAAPPTVNLGTVGGIATQTTLASILTNLGTPFQAGGSIGNTSFGISGTLPAFASTPTFNLGTLNGAATAANQTAVTGPVAAGTAATNSRLVGGVFNSTPITVANTQQAALQIDANGYLKVNISAGGGSGGGTSSNFAAAFPAAGTAVGMSQGGNMVALTGTSGNLNVQCANCSGSGVSTVDEAAYSAGASLFAGSGGFFQTTATNNALTNLQQGMFQVTAQRALFTNLRNASGAELGIAAAPLQVSLANTAANGTALLVTGTGGTFPVTGPLTDTQLRASAVPVSLASTTITGTVAATQSGAWTVNPTTAATWGINTLGSTTSGQSGELALGAVTTAAPTYTTAQSNALSLTTAGALRVDGSGVTQPVSLTSTTVTGTVAVTQSGAWSLSANQSVNVAQINGVTPLMGNGVTGTGSPRVTIASDNTAFSVNLGTIGAAATAAKQPALGTAGSASADVLSVQGIASMTPLLVNPGTAANFGIGTSTQNSASVANGQLGLAQFNTTPTTLTSGNMSPLQMDNAGNLLVNIKAGASSGAVAQGSTTSGQTGLLMQGAVTTAAPTYTTAQTSPLSLTTGGLLRVADAASEASLSTIATLAAAPLAAQTTNNVNIGAVMNAGSKANTIAASATNFVLSSTQGGGTGATGDYLSHCVIQPGTTSPGSFTILDNATTIYSFPGGASSVSNLVSFPIPIGAVSGSGGWKVTTTTNITGTCFGKFT